MRAASSPKACSIGLPSRSSLTTRWNSRREGSAASSTHDLERAHEAVAGAHRAGDDLDVVRELLARRHAARAAARKLTNSRTATGDRQAQHHRAARARQRGEQPADDCAAG